MAWIKLHQSLPTHRKTKRLRRVLSISTAQAVGHLCILWLWALDNCPSGNLSSLDDIDIAEAADFDGDDPAAFVEALRDAGFLDDDMCIHDWTAYAGRLIDNREKNAERMRNARTAKEQTSDVQRTNGTRATNVRNTCNAQTEHVQRTCGARVEKTRAEKRREDESRVDTGGTGDIGADAPVAIAPATPKPRFVPPNIQDVRDYCNERKNRVDPEKWHDFYACKGWMVGKNRMKDWKAAVRTWEARESNAADRLNNQLSDARGRPGAVGSAERDGKPDPAEVERIARELGVLS